MNNLETTLKKIASRKRRVRARISGSAVRPRLCVHVSNKHITAQLINDENSTTIAFVSSVNHAKDSGTMTDKAVFVGTEIAKKAKAKKVTAVVFDRGSRLYHGRIKALADAARTGGLEF